MQDGECSQKSMELDDIPKARRYHGHNRHTKHGSIQIHLPGSYLSSFSSLKPTTEYIYPQNTCDSPSVATEDETIDLPDSRRETFHRRLLRNLLDCEVNDPPEVERPMTSRNSCGGFPLSFDRAGPLVRSSQRWTCSWARLFTQRLWTFGYAEQALASIFDALPAGFCAAIQTASDKLTGVAHKTHALRIADAAAADADAAVGGEDVLLHREHVFLECLEDIWERDGEEGFIEFAFDPVTQQRANVMLNTLTASIAGMHKEEVLARLAAHDAPISFLPLDYLCALLHQSLRAAVPSGPASARTHTDVIYLRMACRGSQRRGSNLIRMETVKLFNANGQVTQVWCVCVCVCARACVRACVRACACACYTCLEPYLSLLPFPLTSCSPPVISSAPSSIALISSFLLLLLPALTSCSPRAKTSAAPSLSLSNFFLPVAPRPDLVLPAPGAVPHTRPSSRS
jgi:hypothetical protein